MWKLGVIENYEKLIEQFSHRGYSPADSENMAKLTLKETTNEMEGITRANIGDAYMLGVIDENGLHDYLLALLKNEAVANYWYDYYVWKRTEKYVSDRENEIIEMFNNGGIEYEEINNILVQDGANPEYIQYFLSKIKGALRKNIKQPTLIDVTRWLNKGIIDTTVYFRYMRKLKYTDETSQYYYLDAIDPDNPPKRKFLTEKMYIDFYIEGYMTIDQLTQTLYDKGITLDDISLMVKKAQEGMNVT
jgi:hypothetical protein